MVRNAVFEASEEEWGKLRNFHNEDLPESPSMATIPPRFAAVVA